MGKEKQWRACRATYNGGDILGEDTRAPLVKLANLRITRYGLALLAITLLGLALRTYHLTAQSIWYDEAYSVWIAKLSVSQLVTEAAANDNHPPLYYLLLHYWSLLFGTSEGAVRFLSLVFGVLAIPMTYAVGRQLFNEEAGLVGALLLALSLLNIQLSQETRMYSLMVLLALVSMYFFLRFLQQRTPLITIGYVLSTVLLLYTHVYAVLILVIQNIYFVTLFLLSNKRTFRIGQWIALEAIVMILFVPWIAVLVPRTLHIEKSGFWIQPPTVNTLVQTFTAYAGTTTLLTLFLILSVLSLFTYYKVQGAMDWKAPFHALTSYAWNVRIHNIAAVYLLVVWVLALNILPFAISRLSTPIYLYKYTIAASVALYLLVAAGISTINWRYAKVGVILVISIVCVANVQPYYTTIAKPQAREAINTVVQNANSGDLAILWPSWHTEVFSYYNTKADLPVSPITSTSVASITNETHSKIEGHDRIWWVYARYDSASNQQVYSAILAGLNESYALSFSKHYSGYDVYLFEKRT
ncbi:MAG: glycosyltransferase family 39 protein [Euryarchaeota archaeon]|nr:glycosyltransferase family 39 protein [Euryarchaeota archaeon]